MVPSVDSWNYWGIHMQSTAFKCAIYIVYTTRYVNVHACACICMEAFNRFSVFGEMEFFYIATSEIATPCRIFKCTLTKIYFFQ